MRVAIGCDHGGIVLKTAVIETLEELGATIEDFGTYSEASVDYPDYALKVAEAVASGKCDCGVIMCGTGIGISIAANKVKGIRAAVCTNTFMGEMTKRHNNANIIALGGRVITPDEANNHLTYTTLMEEPISPIKSTTAVNNHISDSAWISRIIEGEIK